MQEAHGDTSTPSESRDSIDRLRRYYSERLELELRRSTGFFFERFFDELMQLVHGPAYRSISPEGGYGDDGMDGMLELGGTRSVFQLFAPQRIPFPNSDAVAKMERDLAKVLAIPDMRVDRWIFVCNAPEGVGSRVERHRATLQARHPEIQLEVWDNAQLQSLMNRLTIPQLGRLLGDGPENLVQTVHRSFVLAAPPAPDAYPEAAIHRVVMRARRDDPDTSELLALLPESPGEFNGIEDAIREWERHVPIPNATALTTASELAWLTGCIDLATNLAVRAANASDHGADHVTRLMRAAALLGEAGDQTTAAALIEQARELDPIHPAVALHEARQQARDKPRETRIMLEGLEDVDESFRVTRDLLRGQILCHLGDIEAAGSLAKHVITRAPWHAGAQEFEAIVTIMIAGASLRRRETFDRATVIRAATRLAALRTSYARQGRPNAAGSIAFKELSARIMLNDRQAALALICAPEIDIAAREDSDVALEAAHWANMLDQPDRAAELLQHAPQSSDFEVARAVAQLQHESTRDDAIACLDTIAGSASTDDLARARAAMERMLATATGLTDSWSESAEMALTGEQPDLVVTMKAQWLRRIGRIEDAINELLRVPSTPPVLEALAELALESGDPSRAIHHSDRLVGLVRSPRSLLLHARVMRASNRHEEAQQLLLEITNDETVSHEERDRAWRIATDDLTDRDEWDELALLGCAWLDALNEPTGGWVAVHANCMLHDHARAREILRRLPPPSTVEEARLFVAVETAQGEITRDTLETILDLFDLYPEDEGVAVGVTTFVLVRLGARSDLADLEPRLAACATQFVQRFPESRALQQQSYGSKDDFRSQIRDMLVQRNARLAQVSSMIRIAMAPGALLAGAAGRSEALWWIGVFPLPIGDRRAGRLDLDLAAARASIGSPVVWDPSSIVVSSLLETAIGPAPLHALPGSIVPMPAHMDVHRALESLREPARDGGSVTLGQDGEPVRIQRTTRVALEEREIASRLSAVLDQLARAPFRAQDESGVSRMPENIDVVHATLATATARSLPIYSDDRVVRTIARQEGLQAFGTAALLEVLLERGLIDYGALKRARAALLDRGAEDIEPTLAELVDTLRHSDGHPNRSTASAFGSSVAWMTSPTEVIDLILGILETVRENYEERFETHVHELVSALDSASDGSATNLLPYIVATGVMGLLPATVELVRILERTTGHQQLVEDAVELAKSLPSTGGDAVSALIASLEELDAALAERARDRLR